MVEQTLVACITRLLHPAHPLPVSIYAPKTTPPSLALCYTLQILPVLFVLVHFVELPTLEMVVNAGLVDEGESAEFFLHAGGNGGSVEYLVRGIASKAVWNCFLRELGVEISRVGFGVENWFEGRDYILLEKRIPVNVGKERVLLELFCVALCT